MAICGNFLSRGNIVEAEVEESNYKELWDTVLQPEFDTSVDLERGDKTWIEFKSQSPEGAREYKPFDVDKTPIAVEVSGAGSPEVNGVYHPSGYHGGANQFEMRLEVDDADNGGNTERFFELFKVEESAWWNILDNEYPYPVHYGAEVAVPTNRRSRVLPPSSGWAGKGFGPDWKGVEPFSRIKIIGLDVKEKKYEGVGNSDSVAEDDQS